MPYEANRSVRLATETIKAIETAMAKDQGAAYRTHLKKLIPKASDAFRGEEEPYRHHLGASLLGRTCARQIWYGWRWVQAPRFSGRMLRLFNRGHLEEPRLVAALLTIGCEVWQFDDKGKQFRISFCDGFAGGSLDAVVRGIPDLPGEAMLAEFKTHKSSSFAKLQLSGVRESKFEHFVQMQIYMHHYNLKYALYMAVNKDDDEIYAEIIEYDSTVAERFLDRAHKLVYTCDDSPPERLPQASPGWYLCKWCDYVKVCFGSQTPDKNCRTCQYVRRGTGGAWECLRLEKSMVMKRALMFGCDHYKRSEKI